MSAERRRGRRLAGPPAGAEALLAMPVHRVVMAWPEALPALEESGLSLAESGGVALGSVPGAEALAERIVEATGWRR